MSAEAFTNDRHVLHFIVDDEHLVGAPPTKEPVLCSIDPASTPEGI